MRGSAGVIARSATASDERGGHRCQRTGSLMGVGRVVTGSATCPHTAATANPHLATRHTGGSEHKCLLVAGMTPTMLSVCRRQYPSALQRTLPVPGVLLSRIHLAAH